MKQQKCLARSRRQLSLILGLAIAFATITAPICASATSQSYNVLNNKSQPGMLMSLTANTGVVEPATDKNASLLVGVISTGDTAFDAQPGQISVAGDGQVSTLVSTLGGDIRVGDRIAPSSLAGVGERVATSGWIVGIAQGSLDATTAGAVASTITDNSGGKHQVYVASIPLAVHVTYYAAPGSAKPTTFIPEAVQTVADAIAGKHASVLGLVLSFLLLLVGILGAGLVVNGAVRASIAAIARQPLSKAPILRTMLKSIGASGIIVGTVIIGALLLLRIL